MKISRLIPKPLRTQYQRLKHYLGGETAQRRRMATRQARLLVAELSRLGFVEKTKKGKRKVVQFEAPLLATHDELWCPVDLRQFPARRATNDLREPDVLASLSDRLNAPVRVDKLANGKLCLVTRLRAVQFPATFPLSTFKFPPDAPQLAFPLGLDADGSHCWADIEEVKHLLVAGATGGGKTTFMHTLLQTLISRNDADQLELWLIDLKGQEFSKYERLKPQKGSSDGVVRHIATDPQSAIEVLDQAVKEIKRRNGLMQQHDASNLDDLMHLSGQRLRRIVIAIDEVAVLTLDRERIAKHTVGSWAHHLITQIAALGRAAGVHCVVATQHIQKEVLTGLILANFETRVLFSVADWRKSQLVIETSEADGIPTGRMFYRHAGKTKEHQACLVTPAQVRLEVGRIAANGPDGGLGEADELSRFVRDAKLLIKVASDQFEGVCTVSKLYQAEGIRGVIPKSSVVEILQRLERDGILEAGSNKKARRVSRAFLGRPELLDARYATVGNNQRSAHSEAQNAVFCEHPEESRNTAGTQPERSAEEVQRSAEEAQRSAHSEAEYERSGNTPAAFCVPQNAVPVRASAESRESLEGQLDQKVAELRQMLAESPGLADDADMDIGPFRALLEAGAGAPAAPSSAGETKVFVVLRPVKKRDGTKAGAPLVIERDGRRGVACWRSREGAEQAAAEHGLERYKLFEEELAETRAKAAPFGLAVFPFR